MVKITDSQKQNLRDEVSKIQKNYEDLFSKPYRYATWVSNICLGFLAFFVALLLQMKGSNYKINIGPSAIFTGITLVPIIIGFVLRIKWVINETYSSFHSMIKNVSNMVNTAVGYIEEGEEDHGLKGLDLNVDDLKAEKIERWKKNPPLKTIYWQTSFMIMSFAILAIIVVTYLFDLGS